MPDCALDACKPPHHLVQELEAKLIAKEREIALLKSNQLSAKASLFQSLFNNISVGFALHEIILDKDGNPFDYRFLEVNPAFERLTGLKYEAVVQKTVREVIPTIELYWIKNFGLVATEGTPIKFEQYSAALESWYEVYAYSPAPMQFAVMFTDISERKKSEAALKQARGKFESQVVEQTKALEIAKLTVEQERKRFRDVLDMLPAYLILLSPDYKVPFANRYFEDRFGKSDGRRCYEYLFKREEPCENCETFKVFETNLPHRWEWVGPDGRNYDIYDFPFTDIDGSQLIMEMGIDITERKRAESELQNLNQELEKRVAERTAELRSSKDRMQLMAMVAQRLLSAENPQKIIEDLCRLVMEHIDCQFFLNYLIEMPGTPMQLNAYGGIPEEAAATIRNVDLERTVCGLVVQEGKDVVSEYIQNSDDPRTELLKSFGVHAYCCYPLMAQDRLIGILSFGTNKRHSFTVDEVALMKSVCDQVAVAMQRLLNQRELHRINETLEHKVAERTAVAEGRAKQLRSIAVELIETEEREKRQFANLLHDDLQQMLAAAKMHLQAISDSIPGELTLAEVGSILQESIDKTRHLSHALSPPILHHSGLVGALKWLSAKMEKQFDLKVELEVSREPQIGDTPLKRFLFRAVQELLFNVVKHAGINRAHIALSCSDSDIVIIVSDEGNGFDPHTLNASIDGFGLVTIRERARYIEGELSVDSAIGKGSCFTLTVPFYASNVEGTQQPFKVDRPQDPAGITPATSPVITRVLFVDDHHVMRQGLVNLMNGQPNIEVVGEASNGREAIEKARDLKPDVIVMDVSMPEMDGIESTRRIKAELPGVRVIGLSMHKDEQIARMMSDAGAECFKIKTASPKELLKAIYGSSD